MFAFGRTTVGKKLVMAVTGVILIAFLIGHLAGNRLVFRGAAAQLTLLDRAAPQAATIASRTMRLGGLLIAAFVVFHLLHLTSGTIDPAPFEEARVFENVVGSFRIWWVSALYVVAMIAIGLHLFPRWLELAAHRGTLAAVGGAAVAIIDQCVAQGVPFARIAPATAERSES